jgi:hypothetical protein
MKTLCILIALVFLVITTASCERTDQPIPGAGELDNLELTDLSGIPGEYGELVGITTHAAYKGWAQLWFEDEDKTIRVVRIESIANRMHHDVIVIPRN